MDSLFIDTDAMLQQHSETVDTAVACSGVQQAFSSVVVELTMFTYFFYVENAPYPRVL